MTEQEPPVAKYRYTLVVTGNSLDEIDGEIADALNEIWAEPALDFERVGGRSQRKLEHLNPEMTRERYDAELAAWWAARKADKRRDVAEADALRKQVRG